MFKARSYEEAPREANQLPARRRQDVTVTKIECTRSASKGDPMMVWTETIDNGPDASMATRNFFTFSDNDNSTWAKLACICDAAGFAWEEASTLEAFAAQFPLNRLRYSVDIGYTFKITAYLDTQDVKKSVRQTAMQTGETPYKKQLYVSEQEFEAWEGEKSCFAGARDGWDFATIYQKAQAPRTIQFEDDDYAEPTPAGYGDGMRDDGDPLPF